MHIVITNHQEVYGMTAEQKVKLKDFLTFDNPAYKNAKKYGRSRYISIPPYLTYYGEQSVRVLKGERRKVLTCPCGVDLFNLFGEDAIESVHDNRFTHTVSYPDFALDLREDQIAAEKAYINGLKGRYPKCLIQLPTGKGKTILALHIAKVLSQKTLILVHKDDLVTGWQKDIALCYPTMKPGLIKAKSRKVGKQITIATVQTLTRMSEEELEEYTNQFGLVVQDECHHIGLNMFNVIGQFNSKFKLGLTATPKRTDGLSFTFDLFLGGLCYTHTVNSNDEDISQVEVIPFDVPVRYKPFYFDGQCFNYYDYKENELPDKFEFVSEIPYERRPKIPYLTIDNVAVSDESTVKAVCSKIREEYLQGHSILAMFTQKEHIRQYYDYLKSIIPEDELMMYYGDSRENTADMMKRAEDGQVHVTLATYAKATEGTNVKAWEVMFLVSSRNNEKDIEQATGRIRRRKPGKLDPVRVYDVIYGGCYTLRNHWDTHLKVYKSLKYIVRGVQVSQKKVPVRKSMFSRGYR